MAILLFFVVLFVLILIHEWGHFIVAKKTGMRVDEFGIGFPPKLFSFTWHGTEYSFNALPIGGFVRIAGENAEDVSLDGAVPQDSFVAKSKWAQAAVLVAGVTMNILFAWVLFAAVFVIGVPTAVDEESATDAATLTITHVLDNGPADRALLPAGAEVVGVSAGDEIQEKLTPTAFSEFIQVHGEESITVAFMSGDELQEVNIEPEKGLISEAPERAAVGVALSLVEVVRKPVLTAMYDATKTTVQSLGAITVGITTLAIESVRGTADFSQVAGPIGIVSLVGDAAQFGVTSLLMFTAIISLNLAVINMLPFPALDGGRLVMVGIEAITRRPIKPVWVARVNLAGFALLMLLMVAVTWSDVTKLL
jgi:regulator of sigma E protease